MGPVPDTTNGTENGGLKKMKSAAVAVAPTVVDEKTRNASGGIENGPRKPRSAAVAAAAAINGSNKPPEKARTAIEPSPSPQPSTSSASSSRNSTKSNEDPVEPNLPNNADQDEEAPVSSDGSRASTPIPEGQVFINTMYPLCLIYKYK